MELEPLQNTVMDLTQQFSTARQNSLNSTSAGIYQSPTKKSTSDCPHCDGSGWIPYKDPNGYDFAKQCECYQKRITENKFKFANIPEVFSKRKVADFQTNAYTLEKSKELAKSARTVAVNYIINFEEYAESGKGLYFYSSTKGSGKTMLAVAIGNATISEHKRRVRFITTLDLLAEIKATYGNDSGNSSSEIINAMKTIDVLILDDIGTERVTPHVEDIFYQILDTRYVNKRVTIFTSNTHIKNLKHGERIISRIEKMALPLQMPEESVRSRMAISENQMMLNKLMGISEGQTETD